MNYSEAQIYMESLEPWGRTAQPDCNGELGRRLGSPRENAIYLHAAGITGAAAAFVTSILRCAGMKVGRFLPRLGVSFEEQILIGRRRITKKVFGEGVETIKTVCEEMIRDGYECPDAGTVLKALALWYFEREECQVAVLDEQIIVWGELGCLVSKSSTYPGAREECSGELLSNECAEAYHIRYGLERQIFDYKNYKKLEIALAGKVQIDNALLALETIERLRTVGFKISDKALYQGLKETTWPGNFEILHKKPIFIVDEADRGTSAGELARSIELYFENKRIIYIVGMLQNGEVDKVINRTAKYADMILAVTPQHPQALHAYDLAREFAAMHPNVTAVDSPEEAVEISFLLAGKDDVIIAFGTPALHGRLNDILTQKTKKTKKK